MHAARRVHDRRDRPGARSGRSSPARRSARRRRRSGRRARRRGAGARSARPRLREIGRIERRLDLDRPDPSARPRGVMLRPASSQTREPRDEEAARAVDVRQREQELRAARVANCGHSSPSGATSRPARVDDRLVLVGVDRADGVDDRPARPHALGGRAEERELELRQRLRAPAQVGALREHAEARARGVDERPVEAGQLGRQRRRVGVDDRTFVAPAGEGSRELARRFCVAARRRSPSPRSSSSCRRARRRGRARARPPASRPRARRAASRGSAARSGPRRRRARRPASTRYAPGTSVGSPASSPRTRRTTASGGSFSRASAQARRPPEIAHQTSRRPSRDTTP